MNRPVLCRHGSGCAYSGLGFVFQLSTGQLGWSLPAEVDFTRLRQKTVCLARNAYYIVSVIAGVLQPCFMNPDNGTSRGI
jgi:SP family general alpha glucoside:H+ symporter-like MFS transporter